MRQIACVLYSQSGVLLKLLHSFPLALSPRKANDKHPAVWSHNGGHIRRPWWPLGKLITLITPCTLQWSFTAACAAVDTERDTEDEKYTELAIPRHKWILDADSCSQVARHLIGRAIKMQMITEEGEQQGPNLG